MILISTGHHSKRRGACFEGFCEYDEALLWSSEIAHQLSSSICRVVPPGYLRNKVNYINSINDSKLAIEIHFNGAVDSKGNRIGKGSETLYFPGSEKGKAAAEQIQSSISKLFVPDRGVKEGWYRMDKSRGVDYFLAKTRCVAIIIEPEFIHHRELITSNRVEACKRIADTCSDILESWG